VAGARGAGVTALLPFAKYQGAGNDFVVVDGRRERADWATLARRVCDRHFGIGADGLLVAAVPGADGATQRMLMYNPDGSEAEMCGNGLRCFVRWVLDRGEAGRGILAVETGAGVLEAEVGADGRVAVEMGPPRLGAAAIPLAPGVARAAGQPDEGPVLRLPLEVPAQGAFPGARYEATCVSMGNPHAVVFVPDPAAVPLEVVGPSLETHPAFPARTNVELCRVVDPGRLRVRVWERGAGITLACGTGAGAAVVAARLRGYVDERVTVELPGGELEVAWPGDPLGAGRSRPVVLRGPAVHVFDGAFPL
jgi:diaminopimelate epimerase